MANTSQSAARLSRARIAIGLLCLSAVLVFVPSTHAQLNFDVFVGHGLGLSDSTAAEASYFPITCEIQNDGPSFNAIVEISGGQFGGGQLRRIAVELPTHTNHVTHGVGVAHHVVAEYVSLSG